MIETDTGIHIEGAGHEAEIERFFFTTETSYEWSSGPCFHYDDTGRTGAPPIDSLERARELALAARKGRPGTRGYVEVTWGVHYEPQVSPPGQGFTREAEHGGETL